MRIGFGGGCHWCTEAVFQALRGVGQVEQGFIRSTPTDDDWSEAVIVHFDPDLIGLDILTEVHLRTHSSNGEHGLRRKYRSAVYVTDGKQRARVRELLESLRQQDLGRVTRILELKDFRLSEERYRDYYLRNPDAAFCQRFIDPKLDLIRRQFADHAAG